MSLAAQLRTFAQTRERNYRLHKRLDMERASAISKVLRFADRIKGMPDDKALKMIPQVAEPLRAILPAPDSRYVELREKILSLIEPAVS